MLMSDAVRRLRNLINDKPYGYSKSDASPSTNVTANPAPTLKVAFGSGTPVSVSFASAGANTGPIIAGRIQAAIRAALPTDLNFALATCTFADGRYTVKSGAYGETSSLAITPGAANDVTAALKIGLTYGGTEYFQPVPRYTDADLEANITYGINAWNAGAPETCQITLETATDSQLTGALYYAWILCLEGDAGSAVYSYNQTLGADTMSLSQIFTNILDLLRYLRDQLAKMREDAGCSAIFVSELSRYDRLNDMRAPVYIKSGMPRPNFLQLVKLSATSVMIEWQTIRLMDFARVLVYSSPTGGLVDYSKQNEQSPQVQAGAVRPDATCHGQFTNPLSTLLTVKNLASVKQFFVIVFQDSRGLYFYSDEYSLDLTQPTPTAVREVVNQYPKD